MGLCYGVLYGLVFMYLCGDVGGVFDDFEWFFIEIQDWIVGCLDLDFVFVFVEVLVLVGIVFVMVQFFLELLIFGIVMMFGFDEQ